MQKKLNEDEKKESVFTKHTLLRIQQNYSAINQFAGAHLQRTGETIAPSFLSSAKALSTSLRSAPRAAVTSPAETGLPAARMAAKT